MPTVLIAAAANLGPMKQRGEYQDALAFADTDALRALEAITRQRPSLVVLESAFAATSRGTALINRIKADPSLATSEVRIVAHTAAPGVPVTGVTPPNPPQVAPPTAPAPASPPAAPPTVASPPPAAAPSAPLPAPAPAPAPVEAAPAANPHVSFPLDRSGTRRAPRHDMTDNLEVLVDGNPATLIDLSIEGAQLISPTTLKPNQRVRLTLPGLTPLRISGEIAWAMFEMPQGRTRYRVGMAFLDPDTDAIQRFIDGNSK